MFSKKYKRRTEMILQNLRQHIFEQPRETDENSSSRSEPDDSSSSSSEITLGPGSDSGSDQHDTEPLLPQAPIYPNLKDYSLLTVDQISPSNVAEKSSRSEENFARMEKAMQDMRSQIEKLTKNDGEISANKFSPQSRADEQPNPPLTSTGISNPHFQFSTPPNKHEGNILQPKNLSFQTPEHIIGQAQGNDSLESSISLSRLSQQATLALTSVQPFSGENIGGRNWADFKREISQILNLYVTKCPNTSNDDFNQLMSACLKTRLSGPALRYAHNLPSYISDNYARLIQTLHDRFAPPLNIGTVTNELSSLEQKDISVAALEDKINALVNKYAKADKNLGEKSEIEREAVLENLKKQTLHNSLRSDIFAEVVKANKISDFQTMLQFAKEVEANLQILKARAEGSKQSRTTRIMKIETNVQPDPKPEVQRAAPFINNRQRNRSNFQRRQSPRQINMAAVGSTRWAHPPRPQFNRAFGPRQNFDIYQQRHFVQPNFRMLNSPPVNNCPQGGFWTPHPYNQRGNWRPPPP